jgi:hypothetical protein
MLKRLPVEQPLRALQAAVQVHAEQTPHAGGGAHRHGRYAGVQVHPHDVVALHRHAHRGHAHPALHLLLHVRRAVQHVRQPGRIALQQQLDLTHSHLFITKVNQ